MYRTYLLSVSRRKKLDNIDERYLKKELTDKVNNFYVRYLKKESIGKANNIYVRYLKNQSIDKVNYFNFAEDSNSSFLQIF